jgi:hypothetical protein
VTVLILPTVHADRIKKRTRMKRINQVIRKARKTKIVCRDCGQIFKTTGSLRHRQDHCVKNLLKRIEKLEAIKEAADKLNIALNQSPMYHNYKDTYHWLKHALKEYNNLSPLKES